MTAPFEHADEVRVALRSIVSDPALGPDALDNSRIAANLLRDLLPDAPRETGLLLAAISAGAPAMLRENTAQGMDVATAVRLTATTLASKTAFAQGACEWVAAQLAVALDLVPRTLIPSHPATEVREESRARPTGESRIGADGLRQRVDHTTSPDAFAAEPGARQRKPRRARFAVLSAIILVIAAAAGAGIYAVGWLGSDAHRLGSRHPPAHHPKTGLVVSGPPGNAWIAQLASVSLRAGNARLESVLARVRLDVPQAEVLNTNAYASLRPGHWLIYYSGPFTDGTQALTYCASHGRDTRDLCIGRYLSNNPADFGYQCYPPAASPSGNCRHPADMSPLEVVKAYITAINKHNWPVVWQLGGKNLGESYSQLIAGYARTSYVRITSITASGGSVTVIARATETSGIAQRYRLSYLVNSGIITAGQSKLVSAAG
jgi:hypothetical protein